MISMTIAGHLGRDGELRQAGEGSVLTLNVGCRTKMGKETTWVRVSVWGKRGEALAKHCTKGKFVAIRGELTEVRLYDTKDYTRVSVEMRGDDLTFGGGGEAAPKHRTISAPAADEPF